MDCLSDDQITAFVDGRVESSATADRIDLHLDTCPTCRALVMTAITDGASARALEIDVPAGSELASGADPSVERAGRYRILKSLGAGASGEVHAAWDPELNRQVAIKWLHSTDGAVIAPETLERFRREARAMAQVDHPHVVKVFEVGETHGRPFIAMELVEGQSLRDWLKERSPSWRPVIDVFIQAGRGLHAAHGCGLVHRDFKPDNVLVDTARRVRVSDFGMVRPAGDVPKNAPADEGFADLTLTGTVMGTPAYMAPEQHLAMPVGPRADQFAFCVALFEALYGERPYPGDHYAQVRQSVLDGRPNIPKAVRRAPRSLLRTVLRGLASDPRDRFPSMAELLAELEHIQSRGRAYRRIALAALLGAIAVVGGVWIGNSDGSSPANALIVQSIESPAKPCATVTEDLETVWNDGVGRRFVAGVASTWPKKPRSTAPKKLRDAWPKLGRIRGRLAKSLATAAFERWSQARRQACEATFVHQVQSSRLHDLRVLCLDRWRASAKRFVQQGIQRRFSGAEASAALKALKRAVAECDADRVVGIPGIPEEHKDAIGALQLKLDELQASAELNRTAELRKQAHDATDEARRLGYRPTIAAALHLQAQLIDALAPQGEALLKAYTEAVAAKTDALAGDIALALGFNALKQRRFKKAAEWAELTAATYDRAERGGDFYVWVHSVRSFAAHGLGRTGDAASWATKAVADAVEFGFGPIDMALLISNSARMQRAQGDLDGALKILERAVRVAADAGEGFYASKYRELANSWKKDAR